MFGFKGSEVKAIVSISRKLDLDKRKLQILLRGQKAGVPEDQLLADLLGVPEGRNAKEFLSEQLSPEEIEVLRNVVGNMTKGKGTNPLD
jgi:hypothetical protein